MSCFRQRAIREMTCYWQFTQSGSKHGSLDHQERVLCFKELPFVDSFSVEWVFTDWVVWLMLNADTLRSSGGEKRLEGRENFLCFNSFLFRHRI